MKNFLKTLAGIGVLAAIAGAIYYVYKNYLQDKDFEDLDDEDFEDFDDLDDEEINDSRSYVTINLDNAAPAEEVVAEETPAEETPAE